jgi:FkbM family methyltransferase
MSFSKSSKSNNRNMKNIFLDCGTHLCEGLINFYNKGIINDTFEIHTFEANPECNIEERIKQIPLNIIPYNKAVWIEDGFIYFNQENHQESRTGSPTDGYSNIDGWGSSIDGIGFNHPGYNTKVKVPSINFSKFVSEFPPESNIICKIDIEGSEYEVLRHMIRENTIIKIKELYIEFHERFMPAESPETEQKLITQIQDLGIKVHTWF